MVLSSTILNLQIDCNTAIDRSVRQLCHSGFQVMRSFDLSVARAAHVGCSCPYHGTDQCNCQMVVLMVYGQAADPVTLVVHGHDGQTQIALVETPERQIQWVNIQMIMNSLQGLASPQVP